MQSTTLIITEVRSEVLRVVKIQIVVFWVVTLCKVMVRYKHFGGTCCLCLQYEV